MSDTTVSSDLRVQQWADDYFVESVRKNLFKFLMGTGTNAVIQMKEELTKQDGDRITFSLVTRLTGDGVTGDNTLEGNEEALGNYGHRVTIDQRRHGVVVGKHEQVKTKIDLLMAAKDMLRSWDTEKQRDRIIARFMSPCTDSTVTYSAATETQKDTWLTTNNPNTANQRILFGAAKSNFSGVHATDLANIDATADDLSPAIIRLEKRLVQSCRPAIRPAMVESEGGSESEVFYAAAGGLPFRDLEANMDTIFQNADQRGEKNHIFSSGRIKVGNVIVFEVPEMDRTPANGGCLLENVGNGGTTEVEPVFFLGAQAGVQAIGSRPKPVTDSFDYGNRRGVGIAATDGMERTTMNGFMHGQGTIYVSAAGD